MKTEKLYIKALELAARACGECGFDTFIVDLKLRMLSPPEQIKKCACCGEDIVITNTHDKITGATKRRQYCGKACKQKAWRQNRDGATTQP